MRPGGYSEPGGRLRPSLKSLHTLKVPVAWEEKPNLSPGGSGVSGVCAALHSSDTEIKNNCKDKSKSSCVMCYHGPGRC